MQSQRTLSFVKIYSRDESCNGVGGTTGTGRCVDRLNNFQIWVGDDASSYGANTKCYDRDSAAATSIMTVDCAGVGRYLYVMVPGAAEF